jgi:phage head maturation protease
MNTIHKEFSVTTKALDDFTYDATVNTAVKDRAGDVVIPAGARYDNYMKNPVIPYAHDYKALPVAKALDVRLEGAALVMRFQFPPAGTYEFADTVRRLWAGGFLNAVSIGFIPLTWVDNQGQSGKRDGETGAWFMGGTVTEWELLEVSIVPVPANQEALRRIFTVEEAQAVTPDAVPVVEAVTEATPEPVQKEGRVLSQKNRDLVTAAINQMGDASKALQDLLDAADAGKDTEPHTDALDNPNTADTDLPETVVAQIKDSITTLGGKYR